MQLTFLGTACMVPTKERNLPAVFLSYNEEGILFDCGEGTQRQMNIAGIKRTKTTKILISHWHGDHIIGILGLLMTINKEEPEKLVEIYGPIGTIENMKNFTMVCPELKLKIKELHPKGVEKFFENEQFVIECAEMEHSVPCIGYSFVEKDTLKISLDKAKKFGLKSGPMLGKIQKGETIMFEGKRIKPEDIASVKKGRKITYIVDTVICKNAISLAKDSDILISEAVYTSELAGKAAEYQHMTAKDAATIANNANVKKLVLMHFSQRYKTTHEIEEDAKNYFDNVSCAKDFMKLNL